MSSRSERNAMEFRKQTGFVSLPLFQTQQWKRAYSILLRLSSSSPLAISRSLVAFLACGTKSMIFSLAIHSIQIKNCCNAFFIVRRGFRSHEPRGWQRQKQKQGREKSKRGELKLTIALRNEQNTKKEMNKFF